VAFTFEQVIDLRCTVATANKKSLLTINIAFCRVADSVSNRLKWSWHMECYEKVVHEGELRENGSVGNSSDKIPILR